jgi:hypothetical protein
MATVIKNFRIKSGLIVEGTTGTIDGQNILRETGSDSYILNLVGGATLVKSVEATQLEVSGAGKLSVKANVFDSYGSASTAKSEAISAAATDATTKANAAQSAAISTAALDATSKANAAQSAAATDATNKADAAQTLAESFATTAANNAQSAAITAAAADATSKADAAKTAAEATAAAALTTAISTEVSNRNTAISTAVAGVVDSAPELLNTLNELAAALGDSPDTITNLTTSIGNKLPLAGGTLTGALTLSGAPTVDLQAATKKYVDDNTYLADMSARGYADGAADAAEAAANEYTDGEITTALSTAQGYANTAESDAITAAALDATTKADAAEATAQAALDDVLDGTTAFTALNVNDEAKHIAASSSGTATVVATAFEWAKADYRSAKLLVKIDNGTHNELSEILVTLDSTDNIAITEYAIVGTNGSRGTVTADVSGSNVRIRVTPVNNSTVKVTGTLLK